MKERNLFAAMMLSNGDADTLISGYSRSYPVTVKPMLEVIGRAPGVPGRGGHGNAGLRVPDRRGVGVRPPIEPCIGTPARLPDLHGRGTICDS